jgi:small subunit ribosomal protein YMR-31
MHPSTRLLSAQARKPLIQFIGKRQWPTCEQCFFGRLASICSIVGTAPEEAHPHPFAPNEIKNAFQDFVKTIQASGSCE